MEFVGGYIIIIYSAFNLVFVSKEFRTGAVGWVGRGALEDSLACLLGTSLISLTYLTR